jgi:serine/threonine protein phosphatase PrpC
VNGVLAISRAFGDTAFKDENHIDSSLVVSSPEIYSEIVTPMTEFCVIASDGLWDVMEPQAVVNYIRDRINEKIGIETIIKDLVEESIEIGSIDNVTVIILIFHLDKIAPASCGLPTIDSMSNLQSVNNV